MIGHPTPASPPDDRAHDTFATKHGATPPDSTTSHGAPQEIVVSVDDNHLTDMDTVVANLQGVGMVIEEVMTGLGMITGSIPDEEGTETVFHVVGVASVQRQITYQLPPPESGIQ